MADTAGAGRLALPSDRVEHGIPVHTGLNVLVVVAAVLGGGLCGAAPVSAVTVTTGSLPLAQIGAGSLAAGAVVVSASSSATST